MTNTPIEIDPRFCGPAQSGNGGYVSGRLASLMDGPCAVRLAAPPPLGVPLSVSEDGEQLSLFDGDRLIATARPASVTVDPPEPPTMPQTISATTRFRGFMQHPFPNCFVCGPLRGVDDGLRIFPGPVAGRHLVAAPWMPGPKLGGLEAVEEPFVWAALDCPGAYAVWPDDGDSAVVLGELTVRIESPVPVGSHLRVVGWPIAVEGRKRRAGTALFGEKDQLLAVAEALWFTVSADAFENRASR